MIIIYYLDRKMSADLQARIGPSRTGPIGVLQPIANFIKLLQKRSLKKPHWKEKIWVCFHTMVLYSCLTTLPLGSLFFLVDTEISAFFSFWSLLVFSLGTLLLGFNQATLPGWLGGIKVATQTLAGTFPALISLLCAGMRAGSFKWSVLAHIQSFPPWTWTFLANPFQTLSFSIFLVSGLILTATPPLDGGQSLSDLHGGATSHLSAAEFILFRFGKFYTFFSWCLITVVLFLGAWILPNQIAKLLQSWNLHFLQGLLESGWLLLKTYCLMLIIVWTARVNPKIRVDQVIDFAWKILSPFSLIALMGAAIWSVWGGNE